MFTCGVRGKLVAYSELGMIEAWLRADITLKASVIHERLGAEHGFTGHYQRTKMHLAGAGPLIAAERALAGEDPVTGLHRRFEVAPGTQPNSTGATRATCWPTSGSGTSARST